MTANRQNIDRQPPSRGFPLEEFEQRTRAAQQAMRDASLDALLFLTEPEVRYFSGFLTRFWESPTRPWFLVVPADAKPIAVIPEIGAAGMATTWIDDIRTWSAPQPADDGVSILSQTLNSLPARFGRVGVPMGHETGLRMPLNDFYSLAESINFVDATAIIQTLRQEKSELEIEKIARICSLASDGFDHLADNITVGMTEREVCRVLVTDLLARGADACPYVVAASGPGSYDNIIMGPTDRVIESGDVLIIDTGSTYDGYFCDFDRNWAFGNSDDSTLRAYDVVYQATEAGLAAARPGATAADLYQAMWDVLEKGGALGNDVGRLGHGLGMQLTEQPSNMPSDHTVLRPGMVMTLEPGMEFSPGKLMVHEENIVIREGEPQMLSRRALPSMYRVD